jgi:hypothetical protein
MTEEVIFFNPPRARPPPEHFECSGVVYSSYSQNNINYPKNDPTAEIKNIQPKRSILSHMCLDLYKAVFIQDFTLQILERSNLGTLQEELSEA